MRKLFHNFLYKKSLKFQTTTAIMATILLPVLIIGTASAINVSKSNTSLAIGTVTQISANVTAEFNSLYSDINLALMRLSVSDEVINHLSGNSTEYELFRFYTSLQNDVSLSRLFELYPIIEGITFVRSDGSAYTYSTSSSAVIDYDTGSKNVVNQILAAYPNRAEMPNTHVKVSAFPAKSGDTANYISFIRCVYRNSRPIGYALVNFDASMFKTLWHSVNTSNIEIQILCRNGDIIYHDNNSLINTTSDLFQRDEFNNRASGNFTAKTNSTKQFIVYDTSKKSNCLILTSIPVSLLRTPSNNVVLIIVITCILMILFTFTMSFLLMKSILKPALTLRDYVSNFGKGKFEVITEEFPQNEIGELADTYNSMARKITDMIEQVYNAEIEKSKHTLAVKQAELHAMQMQITPHFIYNTLSTISAHAILINNTEIQDMVNSLSSLMRYSLGQVWIPTTLEDDSRSFGGIGIKNIHKRIQLIYGSEYGLQISNNPRGGTTITAVMPLHKQS